MPAALIWFVTGIVTAIGAAVGKLGWKKITGLDASKQPPKPVEDIDPYEPHNDGNWPFGRQL